MSRKAWYWVTGVGAVAVLAGAIWLLWFALMSARGDGEASAVNDSPSAAVSASATSPEVDLLAKHCMDPNKVPLNDPELVSRAYVEVAYCWDATQDTMTTDGELRAEPLMTPEYYSSITAPERSALSAQFAEAAKIHGYTDLNILSVGSDAAEGSGESGEDTKSYGWYVQWTWRGDDGQTVDGGSAAMTVYVVQRDGVWLVNDVEVGSFQS